MTKPVGKRIRKTGRGASMRTTVKKKKMRFKFPRKTLLAVLVFGLVYLLVTNSKILYERINTQKIEAIVIEGGLENVQEEEIKIVVLKYVDQSLVAINLDEIKQSLSSNPWVKSVNIKREWPATLVVEIKEETAIANWGNKQLLNQEGEIFKPKNVLSQINLPYLSGPEGSEQRVMEQYQQFNLLLYPQGLRISSLKLNSRLAWSVELENGIHIKVGNKMVMERMKRFVESIGEVFKENFVDINTIDLRYNNGIAVGMNIELNEDMVSL